MKKITILFALIAVSIYGLKAQIAWPQNGTSIYYNGGNVGIGTNGPLSKLNVNITQGSAGGTVPKGLSISDIGTTGGLLDIGIDASGTFYSWLQSRHYNSASYFNLVLNPMGGNVGIGTITPSSKLEVLRFETTNRTTCSDVLTITSKANTNPYNGHGGAILFKGSNYQNNDVDYARIGTSINSNSIDSYGSDLFFEVSPTSSGTLNRAMTIKYNGNVGIETITPSSKLEVLRFETTNRTTCTDILTITAKANTNPYNGHGGAILFKGSNYQNNDVNYARIGTSINSNSTDSYGSDLFFEVSPTSNGTQIRAMTIKYNGNVGIGTTNPGNYKLAVEGTIGAREVKVTTAAWADFVFHPTYKLRTLGEVEQFIKANSHLPEIPTEAEVKENGVSLGEMNAKLLQKVEELTLYLIEQQKQINGLKAQNLKFSKDLETIKK